MQLFKLLSPKILAMKNYWKRRTYATSDLIRDMVIIGFGLVVMVGVFKTVTYVLGKLNADPNLVLLPPMLPLGLIFLILSVMLFLSNMVSAIGTLYYGQDLDLLLATPVKRTEFFAGKYAYVFLSASWTSLIFIFPLIAAFGVAFSASWSFYPLAFLLVLPYFLIPTGLSIIVGTLFVKVLSPARLKFLVVLVVVGLVVGTALGISLLRESIHAFEERGQLLRLLTLFSYANASFAPSHWVAAGMEELLQHGGRLYAHYALLLYSVAIAAAAAAFIVIELLHFDAYSVARNLGLRSKRDPFEKRSRPVLYKLPFVSWLRALMIKDGMLFVREITSTVQVFMLGALCLIYLFNMRLFGSTEGLPPGADFWWKNFFFISNWCIGAFITTGLCTRFVFPTISMEGKNLWILQSSPLTMKEILHAKFLFWFPSIAVVTAGVLTAGALSVGSSWILVVTNFFSGIIVGYGITGIAVGLGARFSNFDWEHPSQLAASFGSLVFMLTSIVLVMVSISVIWVLLVIGPEWFQGTILEDRSALLLVPLALSVLLVLHGLAKELSLRSGAALLAK